MPDEKVFFICLQDFLQDYCLVPVIFAIFAIGKRMQHGKDLKNEASGFRRYRNINNDYMP
ncbi:MAG TPA: hypothetical protein DIW30_08455 [Bacteroidales bacterium]|nr:hypothetical protein [Bacteroidales bacterium]